MDDAEIYSHIKVLCDTANAPVVETAVLLERVADDFPTRDDAALAVNSALRRFENAGKISFIYGSDGKKFKTSYFHSKRLARFYEMSLKSGCVFPLFNGDFENIPEPFVKRQQIDMFFKERGDEDKSDFIYRLSFEAEIPAIAFPSGISTSLLVQIAEDFVKANFSESLAATCKKRIAQVLFDKGSDGQTEIIDKFLQKESSFISILSMNQDAFFIFAQLFEILADIAGRNPKVKSEFQFENFDEKHHAMFLQSLSILSALNACEYEKKCADSKIAAAMNIVMQGMGRPPFVFSLNEILRFKNAEGVPVASQFSAKALHKNLIEESNFTKSDLLPRFISFRASDGIERYVLTAEVFTFIASEIRKLHEILKLLMSDAWRKKFLNFEKNDERRNADAFKNVLSVLTKKHSPNFLPILYAGGTRLAYAKTSKSQKRDLATELFDEYGIRPLPNILGLTQKIVADAADAMLPFWYRIPILANVVRFFARHRMQKNIVKDAEQTLRISKNAECLRHDLLGEKLSLDDALERHLDSWNIMVDMQARDRLTLDTNRLIIDYTRKNILRCGDITLDDLKFHAGMIIKMDMAASKIRNRAALLAYVKLYIVKCMQTFQ